MHTLLTLCLSSLWLDVYAQSRLHIPKDSERLKRGEDSLELLEKRHRSAHSPCWQEAVKELKQGCASMSDGEQSVLALQFGNCHLKR